MRKISALLASWLCVCMLLLCIPGSALSGQNSLTLHYYATNEALPLVNAEFYLYRVAEPDGSGSYTLTEDFSQYQVDISDLDWDEAGRLTMLAITLSAYAARDELTPLEMKNTDAKGDLTFEGLEDGLYLVFGNALTVAVGDTEWNFTPQPLLLPLPYPGLDGSGINDMEVDVKYDRFPPPTMDDLVDLTVIKVWEDGGEHPDSITAQLMRNGLITDSVELNADNDWQYTWKNLNSGFVWQIAEEDVPDGYTVSVHQEGYTFTITNTSEDIETTTETTTDTTTETATENTTSVVTEETAHTTTEPAQTATVTGTPKLPQTGQLWWPVPVLTGAGFLFLGIGLFMRRGED